MKLQFKVVGSSPSNEGKTHVWKLLVEELVKVFGVEKTIKRTYYIGGMTAEGKEGTIIEEDMNRFVVTPREFVNPETAEVMTLKWLHAKAKADMATA
jgi:hypothetical protein